MTSLEPNELSPKEKSDKRKYYESVLDEGDINASGGLDPDEFKELINSGRGLPEHEDVFDIADRNKDGTIDIEEFTEIVANEQYQPLFQRYVNMYMRFILPPRHRRRFHVDIDEGRTEVDGVYEDSYGCWPPPIAMVFFAAFEIACFITDEISEKNSTLTGSGIIAKFFIYDPRRRSEVWRYLTYMFVHIGYMHLGMNVFIQLILGVPLEMVHKWWRVLLVYLSGVIAGSLTTSVTDPKVPLAGASGGVYAIMTAHIATIIMNWKEMSFPLVQLLIFVIIISVDTGTAIHDRYWLEKKDKVAYNAHLAGGIAGLLVGIWVLKNFIPTKKETYLWWFAVIIYTICMGVLVILNIFWTDHFPKSNLS